MNIDGSREKFKVCDAYRLTGGGSSRNIPAFGEDRMLEGIERSGWPGRNDAEQVRDAADATAIGLVLAYPKFWFA